MNCPKCNRNLVATLSICPACGAMMNDSVREELEVKISTTPKPVKTEFRGKTSMPNKPIQPPHARAMQPALSKAVAGKPAIKNPAANKHVTTEISSKLTSPTLVDFQPKSAALPEWRLQLQNAVRQRKEQKQPSETSAAPTIVHRTNGSTALKPEILELEKVEQVLHENETVSNALRRIEQSRKMFYVEEKPKPTPVETTPKKDFPFHIAAKNDEIPAAKPEAKSATNFAPVTKPKLVSSLRGDKPDFDTNKLPPLPQAAKLSTSFEKRPTETPEKIETTIADPETIEKPEETIKPELPKIKISHQTDETTEELIEAEAEEIEDCAPFAMRFNAGLFDVLIGSFASLILLAPFILLGGNWFTLAGLFAFLATSAIVMFVYMTTAIGLFGKTFGMKMFSLEIIDIEENDYPTFHQAAVSSSVYLLSLALGGTGFLTVPFTSDRRAVHDIVSGTVVVREYE